MLQEMKLTGFQVQNYGGLGDLSSFLKTLQRDPSFTTQVAWLGIVRDAETAPAAAAFQSVCSILQNFGLAVPQQLMTIEAGIPSRSVYILPDCNRPGVLADRCLAAGAGDCLSAAGRAQGRAGAVEPERRHVAAVTGLCAGVRAGAGQLDPRARQGVAARRLSRRDADDVGIAPMVAARGQADAALFCPA